MRNQIDLTTAEHFDDVQEYFEMSGGCPFKFELKKNGLYEIAERQESGTGEHFYADYCCFYHIDKEDIENIWQRIRKNLNIDNENNLYTAEYLEENGIKEVKLFNYAQLKFFAKEKIYIDYIEEKEIDKIELEYIKELFSIKSSCGTYCNDFNSEKERALLTQEEKEEFAIKRLYKEMTEYLEELKEEENENS